MSTLPHFPFNEKISRIENPLQLTAERSSLFIAACREMAEFHQENNPELRHLYKLRGFEPKQLREEIDLSRLPSIQVTAMKHYLLTSLPHESAVLKLTSSGTRGQKTQIWFDQESLDRVQEMLLTLWKNEGIFSTEPANYMMFVYDPEEAKDLGIAFSDKNQQRFAPVNQSFYTIRKGPDGGWQFNKKATLDKFRDYENQNLPVRLFGIPSFMFEFLEYLESEKIFLNLPRQSLVMTGGGWKAAEDKKVTRAEFRQRLAARMNIPLTQIRDGFGMAEHSAPYIECKFHRFHIPCYNRILIRDPYTMRVLPPGNTGMLELITPFNAMMPTLSVLSTDLGFIDPTACECGSNTPTFTIVGRGGISKHKGCAIHASEIVARKV